MVSKIHENQKILVIFLILNDAYTMRSNVLWNVGAPTGSDYEF